MGRPGIPIQVRREFWQQVRIGLPIFKAAQVVGVQDNTKVAAIDARIRELIGPYRTVAAAAVPAEQPIDEQMVNQLQLLVAQSVKVLNHQQKQTRYLATIRGWVVFFGVLWLIGFVIIAVADTAGSN